MYIDLIFILLTFALMASAIITCVAFTVYYGVEAVRLYRSFK